MLALAITGAFGLTAQSASAQTKVVAIEWDANTDAQTAGYQVLVGTSPGSPIAAFDVGRATRTTLPLPLGGRYFVTVRAYGADGAIGPTSAEVTADLTAAPERPAGLTASVVGSSVQLTWAAPVSGAAPLGYVLSVGTFRGGSNLVDSYPVGAATSIGGAVPPGVYYARVRAANLMGFGPLSDELAFVVGAGSAPAPPTTLSVSWSGTVARLAWSPPPSGAAPISYLIEAGTSPGVTDVGAVDVGNTTSFAVDLPAGSYYARVRAVGTAGVSAPSNEVLVTRGAVPAPGAVPAIDGHVQGGSLVLDWETPTTGGPVEGYVVEAGSGPGLSDVATLTLGNTKVFSTPAPLGTYYIRVRATNSGGVGAPSPELVIRR